MKKLPDEKILLRGRRFDVHEMRLQGSDGKTYRREVVRHPGAVVILPVLDDGRIVMIRNYRPTIDLTLLELPAGTRETAEPPEVTAARELTEETGYTAGRLEHLLDFYSAPGICDELMHLYVASDLTAGEPVREAVEQIENKTLTRDEIENLISGGEIQDAKSLAGLLWWLRRDAGDSNAGTHR